MKCIEFKDHFTPAKLDDGTNGYLEKGQTEVYTADYTAVLIKDDLEHDVVYKNVPFDVQKLL